MGNESFNRRLIDEYLNQHKTKSNELVNTLQILEIRMMYRAPVRNGNRQLEENEYQ